MPASFRRGTHPLENELNKRVLSIASEHNYKLYLVGGYVRDALMNDTQGKTTDLDYAVISDSVQERPAMRFASILAEQVQGHYVPLDESNDTARVVLDDGRVLDLAGCVGGNIETDIMRRDFSINALVWDPARADEIIDLVNGIQDLDNRSIRAVSEASFKDDPLRMLRAFRFSATLGGTITAQTLVWIGQHVRLLNRVAAERVNHELFLILGVERCAPLVWQMAETGILEVIFPELVETRRVTANAFHHLGLFEHSLETVPQLEAKLDQMDDWVRASARTEVSPGVTKLAATKLACILHDIGKPQTWAITEEGRHTFYGHDKLGAEMCELVAQRMKWSRDVERLIVNLVRWHLRPGALFHHGEPTEKAVRRFYRSIMDDLPELILLAFGDFGATRGPGLMGENRQVLENSLFALLKGFVIYKDEIAHRIKFLNGTDVMRILSISSGPIVGEILAALEEAQEFKEVSNRADAEQFVKTHYEQKYSK